MLRKIIVCFVALLLAFPVLGKVKTVYCVGTKENDIVSVLRGEKYKVVVLTDLQKALNKVPSQSVLLVLNPQYPASVRMLSDNDIKVIREKQLRVYTEFASISDTVPAINELNLERVVATQPVGTDIRPMDILSINRSFYIKEKTEKPALVVARVAGFDKAVYGLKDTEYYPLIFKDENGLIRCTSQLSNFARCRFMPEMKWKTVWEYILGELTGENISFTVWPVNVAPSYGMNDELPQSYRIQSVRKGVEWFFNGHFLVDPSWKETWLDHYTGDGNNPIGPSLPDNAKDGDGSMGILEGHCSAIYSDGRQAYRYWLRDDVQGEASMAFALAGKILDNQKYSDISSRIIDYAFNEFGDGPRNDPKSPTYGLLGWATTHKDVYYGDDNARSILGMWISAKLLGSDKWDERIARTIEANLKTTGKYGFRSGCLRDPEIQKNGLEYYKNWDIINPSPHYESWIWACYLLYFQKTGRQEFYDLAETAIRLTMKAYPGEWKWTNGIQQERARMILPLAWLYRVSPTTEHYNWLRLIVNDILKSQVNCGAIMEQLGDPSKGKYGRTKSNQAYGKAEAPLIFENGDPVSDMLYTANFAFFALNEAAAATGDAYMADAVNRLADFLVRIQVKSDKVQNVDGAWFRAFNFRDWNYWASNADAGWGAQCTLTGWIQSWILSTLSLMEMNTSYWDFMNK